MRQKIKSLWKVSKQCSKHTSLINNVAPLLKEWYQSMLCTMSFPKTVLVFRNYSFKKLRNLLVGKPFKDFWYVWQRADRSIITFLWSIVFFINRCNIASFMVQGKSPISKPLLSSLCITSVKVSKFVLIIFVGRSHSWQAIELSRLKLSTSPQSLWTWNKKSERCRKADRRRKNEEKESRL